MKKITPSDIKILILCWMAVLIILHGTDAPLKAQPVSPSQTPGPEPEVSQPSAVPPSQPTAPVPTPPIRPIPRRVSPSTAPQPSTPPAPQPSPPSMPPTATPISPATPPTTPSPQVMPPTRAGVVFNFDNADIYEVIRVMGEILRMTYIVDPRVKGVVNIHTSGQIPAEEAFPIFQSILRLNGATAVKRDGLYEIVPMSEAKKLPISPTTIQESGKPISTEKYIIQIISLKYIPVAEVSKMIKPFLSDGADIVEHLPLNILIIGDLASNVKKSMDIIGLFDMDIFTDLRVRIYPILNADVAEVAKEMERIFSSFEVSTKSGRGVGITFTPIVRINSLLVVSSIPNIFEKVEGWLKELDKIPMEGTKYSVFVYYVQNAKAKDLADVLKQIFVTTKEKKEEFKQKVAEPLPRGTRPPTPTPSPTPSTPTAPEAAAVAEGEINIVVDETNNALVVRAFARDYKSILEAIKKLDIYPRQVLIEVLLADIVLTDNAELGIDLIKYLDKGEWQQTIQFGTFSSLAAAGPGLSYTIVEEAGRFSAAIKAAATLGRLRVLTSPHLLASNNKEAKIQVGTSEPILTNTYTSTGFGQTTTTTGYVEGTIEYKDIGTILSITPRISDGGLVTLELSIEESSLDSRELGRKDTSSTAGIASASSTFSVPAFNKTTAKTVLSIKEGQTIAIGGLIRNVKGGSSQGLPLLSKIPLLGFFFGKQKRTDDRRELILLLTPHVITDENQSKTVTDEFKEKVEGLRKEMEKERIKREKK